MKQTRFTKEKRKIELNLMTCLESIILTFEKLYESNYGKKESKKIVERLTIAFSDFYCNRRKKNKLLH